MQNRSTTEACGRVWGRVDYHELEEKTFVTPINIPNVKQSSCIRVESKAALHTVEVLSYMAHPILV